MSTSMSPTLTPSQHGRLVIQILGVRHLGTEYPQIVATVASSGSTMSWTFIALTTARDQFVSSPGAPPGLPPIDTRGPPRLLLHVLDALKGFSKPLGSASVDIAHLQLPPHATELWAPLQGGKRPTSSVHIRVVYVQEGEGSTPVASPRGPADIHSTMLYPSASPRGPADIHSSVYPSPAPPGPAPPGPASSSVFPTAASLTPRGSGRDSRVGTPRSIVGRDSWVAIPRTPSERQAWSTARGYGNQSVIPAPFGGPLPGLPEAAPAQEEAQFRDVIVGTPRTDSKPRAPIPPPRTPEGESSGGFFGLCGISRLWGECAPAIRACNPVASAGECTLALRACSHM